MSSAKVGSDCMHGSQSCCEPIRMRWVEKSFSWEDAKSPTVVSVGGTRGLQVFPCECYCGLTPGTSCRPSLATGWPSLATGWPPLATGWPSLATGWAPLATGWSVDRHRGKCSLWPLSGPYLLLRAVAYSYYRKYVQKLMPESHGFQSVHRAPQAQS